MSRGTLGTVDGATLSRRRSLVAAGAVRAAFALATGLLLAILALTAFYYARYALGSIGFPYELDYGEGIVWQQMDALQDGFLYRPVHDLPHIVYHYTPLSHAVTKAIAALWGDPLAAGRAVSVVCTVFLVVFAGLAASSAAGPMSGALPRLVGGLVGGLMVLGFAPLYQWSTYFRVDMMAVMFAGLGLALFFASLTRPRLFYLAGLAFVAAIYAKQSIIVSAAACFLVSYLLRPALTLRVAALCAAVGAAALAALVAATDGEVLRHLFLYNTNPYLLDALVTNIGRYLVEDMNLAALALVPLGLLLYGRRLTAEAWTRGHGFRAVLGADPRAAAVVALGAHFVIGLVAGFGIGKWGAAGNYFNEWFVGWAVSLGLGAAVLVEFVRAAWRQNPRSVAIATATALMLAATVHVFVAGARWTRLPLPDKTAAAQRVLAAMAATPGPIYADDMVLIRKAGKPVLIEPVIMTMLAGAGLWDERPFVARLASGWFDLVVVRDDREDFYTSAMWTAIHTAYPVAEPIGRFTVFRRPAAALPR
ncbi:MAG: hypothetical protein FJX67_03350 [Alphaproteobacteria bacterium]|nr:hypothetical protein [Alphaproteobacteria bacterium]